MARVSEIRPDFQPPQEDVTDKPTPGFGYVVFILCLLGGIFAWLSYRAYNAYLVDRQLGYTLALPALLTGAGLILILHAAFFTTYRIDSEKLALKSGLFRGSLPLVRIKEISRKRFNWRVLGWGIGRRGFCNRFTDGVKLITDKESIYVSPTNPQLFMSQLRTLRFSKADRERTGD